jgi:type II secretory pathway pseudopilin PulG
VITNSVVRIIIYVAIVVFLALQVAIAIPSFLEAQIRSTDNKAKAELWRVAVAIEAYRNDHGAYPPPAPSGDGWTRLPVLMTTPKAYLPSLPTDRFDRERGVVGYALTSEEPGRWSGLIGQNEEQWTIVLIGLGPTKERGPFRLDWKLVYDPTNGTQSPGYIHRFSNPQIVEEQSMHWSHRMAQEKKQREAESVGE